MTGVFGVDGVVDLFKQVSPELVDGFPQNLHEIEPADHPIFLKCFLEGLELELLQEYAIGLQGFIEGSQGHISRLFGVEAGHGPVDRPEVRHVIILVQGQLNLANQSVDLRIQLNSEESHPIITVSFIFMI